MATVTTNNDGKILGGYLKEKLTIALTRINDDELTRAVTKVCSHKLKIPNEKHMQRLLQATFGSYAHADNSKGDISRWIVDNLEEHLHAHNWVVVLKTQLAFHRLMQDGSDDINIRIQSRRNLFAVSRTKDLADSPDGAVQSIFVQQYMRYLEERSIAQDSVRLGVRLENRAFGDTLLGLEPRKAVQATAAFLLQFEVAADVQFFEEAVNNYATLLGHQNVLNDAKLLFVALSRSILRVVQMAPALSPDERDTWRPLIKRYNAITVKFVNKLEKMRASRVTWGEQLPALQVLPPDAIASVLAALDGAPAPSSAASPMGSPDAMPTVSLADLMKRAGAAGAMSAGAMSSTSLPEGDEDAELAAAIRASLEEQEQRQKQEELLRKYNGTANPAEAAAAAAAASATSPSIAAPAAAAASPPAPVAPAAPVAKKTGLDDLFGPGSPPPAATPSYAPSSSASASVDLFGGAGPRPGAVPAPTATGGVDLFAQKPTAASPTPAAPVAAANLFAAPPAAAAAPAVDVFASFSAPAPTQPAYNVAPAAAPAAPPKPSDPFAGAFANVAVASPAFATASSSSAGAVHHPAAAAAPAAAAPSLFGPATTAPAPAPAPAPAAVPYPDMFAPTKQRDDTFQATLDFFAPPSSQPAPAPKPETFDPFGNTDANGRQRAW